MRPTPTIDPQAMRRLNDLAQLQAISAALDTCSADDRELLGHMLVRLATPPAEVAGFAVTAMIHRGMTRLRVGGDPAAIADAALFQLARSWSLWSSSVRTAALPIGRGRWSKFGEVLARESDASRRAGFTLLVIDANDASLARSINMLLSDRDRGVAQAAERAWIEIAARMGRLDDTRLLGVPRVTDALRMTETSVDDDRAFRSSLAEALRAFPEHRCRGVLLAAILLLDARSLAKAENDAAQDPLAAIALSREEGASGSLRGFLRSTKLPIVAERALEWSVVPAMARAAGERLTAVASPQEVACLARRWSLAHRPNRATLLRDTAAPALAKPSVLEVANAKPLANDDRVLAAVPALLTTLRYGTAERSRMLEPLLLNPSPLVRHALARWGSHRDATDLAFDGDARVARSGALRASLVGTGRAGLSTEEDALLSQAWRAAARAPDAGVRSIARGELARMPAWETGQVGGRSALRRALVSDREGTLRTLEERLRRSTGDNLTPMLTAVRLVGLVPELESLLIELASHLNEDSSQGRRSLASLIASLGEARGAASLELLQQFREHPDDRVRANAVQALGRRARVDAWNSRRLITSMIELKSDGQHRVRANALRSVLDVASTNSQSSLVPLALTRNDPAATQQAIESLVSMLTDERAPHRLAGVWLASRTLHLPAAPDVATRTPEISARVLELARFDADPAVRHRASATADRIARETRMDWKTQPRRFEWSAA